MKTTDTWTYSDKTFLHATKKILSLFKIDYSHDIPYVAGYDVSGKTIFIDKDIYNEIKKQKLDDYLTPLCMHEAIEKIILMHSPEIPYLFAHQNALRLEEELLASMKIDKKKYNAFMSKYIKKIAHLKEYPDVPKNLDLKPYEDEKDYETLKKMCSKENFELIKNLK